MAFVHQRRFHRKDAKNAKKFFDNKKTIKCLSTIKILPVGAGLPANLLTINRRLRGHTQRAQEPAPTGETSIFRKFLNCFFNKLLLCVLCVFAVNFFLIECQPSTVPASVTGGGKINGAGDLVQAFHPGFDAAVLVQRQPSVTGRRLIDGERGAFRQELNTGGR
jgi:hypothetical protein